MNTGWLIRGPSKDVHVTNTRVRTWSAAILLSLGSLGILYWQTAQQAPYVHVRWAEHVSSASRDYLERRFLLAQPTYREGSTWAYDLLDTSQGNIRALVEHADVADTHNIERASYTIPADGPSGSRRAWAAYQIPAIRVVALLPASIRLLLLTAVTLGAGGCFLWTYRFALARSALLSQSFLEEALAKLASSLQPTLRTWAWRDRLLPFLLVSGAAMLLCIGFTAGSNIDDEEYRATVLSTVIHARALLDGQYPFWTSLMGLGVPHPLAQSLLFHPLMPLYGITSPDVAVMVTYLFHVLIGALGFWCLSRRLGISPGVSAVCTATFLLSTASLNYVLTDLWLQHFVTWTTVPWVLLIFVGLMGATLPVQRAFYSVTLGLLAGLTIANGHLGYLPVYLLLGVFLLVGHHHSLKSHAGWLLLAGGVAAAIGATTVLNVYLEYVRFPADVPRFNYPETLSLRHVWDLFFRPIRLTDGVNVNSCLAAGNLASGARVPFFGGPFTLLAICYLVVGRRSSDFRADLSFGFLATAISLTVPGLVSAKTLSGIFLFRDPFIICGVLMAGLMLSHLKRVLWPQAYWAIVMFQLGVVILTAWPFVHRNLALAEACPRTGTLIMRPTAVSRVLTEHTAKYGGRMYYSAGVDSLVRSGALLKDGLSRNSMAYRGVMVVNGDFKGISVDTLFPSKLVPYGSVSGQITVSRNGNLLDMLGIRHVVALVGEPVAADLLAVRRLPTATNATLVLYRNVDAWPGAAFLEQTEPRQLPRLSSCEHDRFLCADPSRIHSAQTDMQVTVRRSHGRINVTFPDEPTTRTLSVAEMYRVGWVAQSRTRVLKVSPAMEQLIGVEVPPGTREVTLSYRDGRRIGAVVLSLLTIAISIASMVALRQRHAMGCGR